VPRLFFGEVTPTVFCKSAAIVTRGAASETSATLPTASPGSRGDTRHGWSHLLKSASALMSLVGSRAERLGVSILGALTPRSPP
jgi:hypothetical protein